MLRLDGAPEVEETMEAEEAFGLNETLADEEVVEEETTVTKGDLKDVAAGGWTEQEPSGWRW